MTIFNSKLLPLLAILILSVIIACGEEDVPGCTNSLATNYNSSATVDDGSCIITGCTDDRAENFDPSANQADAASCVFARDKFLGTYLGSLNCLIIDQFNSDTTTVMLTAVDNDVTKISITLSSSEDFTLPLDATVDGDDILMSTTDFPVTVDILGMPTDVLVDVDGSASINEARTELIGSFTAQVKIAATGADLLNDSCTLAAVKQ